ncbi:NAD(P)H-hydrate dehydratase [Acetobacteraceae bacterium KSS8]|uniref:Bifunctional NAD(P)H-hydrate repair enzyme n=1 Tax=Endosaccharibacter trunci TaxID=2812733 RepID=A0ABT1W4A4_9PROT|nr:NAD(P)H-hydrate dehydratase [Acetobacteraceae bacterium KSS8]
MNPLPEPFPDRLALPTPEEMAALDRAEAAARPDGLFRLMEHAGRAVARSVMRHARPCTVLVLCGPGNNGGDGLVAARILAREGWPVAVAMLATPRPGSDAARAAAAWRGPSRPFVPEEAARVGLVVDAVFGAGLSRPLEDRVAATLAAANRILAVDVPSGLDGGTGVARGRVAPAWRTVTFHRAKPGHLLLPGRTLCGALEVAEIGVDPVRAVAARAWRNEPGLWRLPEIGIETHKYRRGVVSICGGASMPGAARLSAGGARGAGAGLVRIAAARGAELYRAGAPGLIVDDGPLDTLLEDQRRRVWVCGPGLEPGEAAETLPRLLRAGRKVVADAGVLSEAAGEPERLRGVAVATPHAGEFAKLFGDPGEDKVAAARRAAALIEGVVVLKGADTVVAAPDGRVSINTHATPWLGTAGSGDVLSGIVAACLAQADKAGLDAFAAASAAVWLHGDAGLRAGEGLLAEDLETRLPAACAGARARLRALAAGARLG